jgi:predicted nucleotidyltransferase
MDNATPAFITGSQAYGTATPESDIDLVCFVSEGTKRQIIELSRGLPIRFGNLNLILETDLTLYAAWEAAKDQCLQQNRKRKTEGLIPLSKEEVCEIHAICGIPQGSDNPPRKPKEVE